MLFRERREVLEALCELGASRCSYTSAPERWLETRCDCKYGVTIQSAARGPISEANGCPELRAIYALVDVLSDEEWDLLVQRAHGVKTRDITVALGGS